MHGFILWFAVMATVVYTALWILAGFLLGRLGRTGRDAERVFTAEMERLGRIGGGERVSALHEQASAVPDLGDILSHRPKGHRR